MLIEEEKNVLIEFTINQNKMQVDKMIEKIEETEFVSFKKIWVTIFSLMIIIFILVYRYFSEMKEFIKDL